MNTPPPERLGPAEIARLSSPYLDHGIKEDTWEITSVEIDGAHLRARVRMTSRYVSPTDPGGFHLTIFSALEILGQLSTIYLHWFEDLDTKCREVWLLKCTVDCESAIRDPDAIDVEMDFRSVRRPSGAVAARAECRVSDAGGGLFTARLNGMMGAAAT